MADVFDPEGSEYDYTGAEAAGIAPDETGHWASRDPRTGLILKGRGHPTFDKTISGEAAAGYEIQKGEDGRYYSQKKSGNVDDMARIKDILTKNKDKDFVKRVLYKDKYPVIDNDDGSVSTHLMSWGETDGRYLVYPTIVNTKEGLKKLEMDEAFRHALGNQEYIEFDNPDDADWFSKNYKAVW